MFAKFCGYNDSTYARLDMLTFVAENTARYEWNAHVLLKMHGTNLNGWFKTMTDCLNRGDELAIYAMCDMLKWHTFLFTRTKPWTTVDGSIGTLTVPELCIMCDVRLIYLGNNKFGEIKCKPELLSPLPKPKPFKKESSPHTVSSPNEELVVGILDESQSSCTLVSLPCLLETAKIELAKQDISMKLAEDTLESNVSTWPVEMPAVTITNESQLGPPPTPTTNHISPSTSDQALTNEPPISNKSKLGTIDGGPPSSNQQVETERPVTPAEKITKNEPVGNSVSTNQATPPEIKEDGTAENETHRSHTLGVESEPLELPIMTQSPKNKTPVAQESEKPEPHNKPGVPNMRLCTVWLEILMEADIIKHVHVHKETDSKTVVPVETDEPVETVETAHFTRSRAKTKPTRTNRLPWSVSNNIDYVHQDEQNDSDKSPSPKRKWNTRPKREPSSSHIKADSFITKNPSIWPLHKSTRLSHSQKEASSNKVSTETGTGSTTPVSTATTSDTPVGNNSKGTFTTQSYNLKKSKNFAKLDVKCAIQCVTRTRSWSVIISRNTIFYIVKNAPRHSITLHPWPNTSIHIKSHILNVLIVTRSLHSKVIWRHIVSAIKLWQLIVVCIQTAKNVLRTKVTWPDTCRSTMGYFTNVLTAHTRIWTSITLNRTN